MEDAIERARRGDRDALGELWRAHQPLLLRYFRGKGMDHAEDLASNVWIEVASSLSRFRGDQHDFRRWLFTIAARRRIDDIRSQKRSERRLELVGQRTVDPPAVDAASRSEEAEALDRALALVRALPPDQAEAVLLRVVADLSVSEVAEVMGRREGTVRVLVHRGLKRLAEHPAVTNA